MVSKHFSNLLISVGDSEGKECITRDNRTLYKFVPEFLSQSVFHFSFFQRDLFSSIKRDIFVLFHLMSHVLLHFILVTMLQYSRPGS